MNFVYTRRGGPLLSWQNGYPPRQSQSADARSLGDVRVPIPGAPEYIATADAENTGIVPPGFGLQQASTADKMMSLAGGAAATYHGYRRTGSIAWALGWGLLGAIFPIPTNVIAVAQGFGKKKLHDNPAFSSSEKKKMRELLPKYEGAPGLYRRHPKRRRDPRRPDVRRDLRPGADE